MVSTQVVEAGVDLDFATVYRAEAPLDAIIQAAGRCNREGRLGETGGRVVVFKPPDEATPPGVYRSGRDIARVVQQLPDFDPNDSGTVGRYFEWLFGSSVDPDSKKIQQARKSLDFPAVAERFRMIDEDTCDVIVSYPEQDAPRIARKVSELDRRQFPGREALRDLQPYVVSLVKREYERLTSMGFIEPIGSLSNVGRWLGRYDGVKGIVEADPVLII